MSRSLLAPLLVLLAAPAARADIMIPEPGPERLALADAVVVGRVIGIAPQDVTVRFAPPTDPATYRIAHVAVLDPVLGAAGVKTVRVGFLAPSADPKQPRWRRIPRAELAQNQRGLLFLRRVPGQDFYAVGQHFDVIDAAAGNYAAELKQATQQARLLADPPAALRSKDAAERNLAAGLLIQRYRTPRPGFRRTEPVPAEESRLLLTVVAEMDWAAPLTVRATLHPRLLLRQLNLGPADGWTTPPENAESAELQRRLRAWVREHGATYRMDRYVADAAK